MNINNFGRNSFVTHTTGLIERVKQAEQTEATKQCSRCKQIKVVSEFSKNRARKDGYHNQCKVCRIDSNRNYRKTDKSKIANRKGNKKYRKTAKGKASLRDGQKRFYARNPNYEKAKHAVNHAIESGKLISPKFLLCHYCTKPAKEYHHWHGYEPEHWLDVVSVCIECHGKQRRRIA